MAKHYNALNRELEHSARRYRDEAAALARRARGLAGDLERAARALDAVADPVRPIVDDERFPGVVPGINSLGELQGNGVAFDVACGRLAALHDKHATLIRLRRARDGK